MDSELYDRIAKMLIEGLDIDDAVEDGLFEQDEIPEVYEILAREPRWGRKPC